MSVTAFSNGTQAAIVGTEHFVANVNVPGTFTFHVRTNNMVAGDVLEVRVYQMTLTGGAAEQTYVDSFAGAQDVIVKVSVPISNELTDAQALRFSIKQTFGTGRNFDWKVLKHA